MIPSTIPIDGKLASGAYEGTIGNFTTGTLEANYTKDGNDYLIKVRTILSTLRLWYINMIRLSRKLWILETIRQQQTLLLNCIGDHYHSELYLESRIKD